MADQIRFKRGPKSRLPVLAKGEPAICTDTGELFIGSDNGNVLVVGVGVEGPKGDNGIDGKSAYDLWVSAGNTGTVQTFLNSLKGAKGDTGAQGPQGIQGLTGNRGADGQNGIDGKSAYQLWLDAGNTGTLQNFLDSLKGPKGDTGEAGTGEGGSVPSNVILFEEWTPGESVTIYTPDTTAPTVTASVQGGTYNTSKSVTLTANETATIYYTLDGSVPTTSSNVYSNALTISANTTLKYFAKDAAGNTSAVQTQVYAFDMVAPTITASSAGGTFTSAQTVTLSSNEAATIYYTLNGTTPTTASTVYSSPITISSTSNLKFFGKDTAGNSSDVQIVSFTINVPDTTAPIVTASPAAGNFTDSQTVSLSANETATIYYTVDGTEPTTASLTYTGPIILTVTTTLKFFARDTAGNSSAVQTVTYTKVAADTSPKILSLNGTSDYIQVPSLTFDEINMIFEADFTTVNKTEYYFDARTGSTAYIMNGTAGTDSITGVTGQVDGVLMASGVTNVTSNKRVSMKAFFASAITDNVTFFASNTLIDFMKAKVKKIKLLLAGTVVASYDFTQQFAGTTIADSSGNGNAATLTGGTWESDTSTPTSTATPYAVLLDGVDDKLHVPIPANTKTIELKINRENSDTSGYVMDLRTANTVYTGSVGASGYNAFTVDGVTKTVGAANATTDIPNGTPATVRYTLTSISKTGNVIFGGHNSGTTATDYMNMKLYAIKFYDTSGTLLDSFDFTTGTGNTLYGSNGMNGTLKGATWVTA